MRRKETHEPGEVIVKSHCPCCGAILSVEYGDDEGEIGIVGSRVKGRSRLTSPVKAPKKGSRDERVSRS